VLVRLIRMHGGPACRKGCHKTQSLRARCPCIRSVVALAAPDFFHKNSALCRRPGPGKTRRNERQAAASEEEGQDQGCSKCSAARDGCSDGGERRGGRRQGQGQEQGRSCKWTQCWGTRAACCAQHARAGELRRGVAEAGLRTQDDGGAGQGGGQSRPGSGRLKGRPCAQARPCCIARRAAAPSSCRTGAAAAGQLQSCARRRPNGCGCCWSPHSARSGSSTHTCTTSLQVDLQPAQESNRQVARSQVGRSRRRARRAWSMTGSLADMCAATLGRSTLCSCPADWMSIRQWSCSTERYKMHLNSHDFLEIKACWICPCVK